MTKHVYDFKCTPSSIMEPVDETPSLTQQVNVRTPLFIISSLKKIRSDKENVFFFPLSIQ